MGTLSTWTRTLCILALAAGTWPLAATGPRLTWTAEAPGPGLRELRIQTFMSDPDDVQPGSYFILESPVPMPPQDLEVFWTAPEREDWAPLAHSVPGEDVLLVMAPVREPGAPGGLEFLVMVQGWPWARGTYDPAPVPGEEDAGDEGDAEEPVAPGSRTEFKGWSGFLEGRDYLLQLTQRYGLTASDLIRASQGGTPIHPNLYGLFSNDPSGPGRALSYARAVGCADALNRINRERGLREAPFTAEELFLGGRSVEALAGAELLKFILLKDRHLSGEEVPAQLSRLGLERTPMQHRVNGQVAITQAFADDLKARLDLAALGLSPADLDRLPSPAARPFKDHPGHERARALIRKAMEARGTRKGEPILKDIGLSKSHWSAIRQGKRGISRDVARKLSAFHNRTFPGEPPVTPDHFLSK